ncbi:MAG: beta-glucuronidase, partial [Oscillospiraceae bacterium]|nr:beta-glucuronidase [Oscillospiraceae bacterium]
MITSINPQGTWQFFADEDKKYSAPPEVFADTIQLSGTTATNHKGNYNSGRETDCLTELYPYSGNAWFQTEIRIPEQFRNKKAELFLERTRITKLWINHNYIGSYNSLCTPHSYDISAYSGKEKLLITICVDNSDYPTKGGHMTSPDTQTNWNGITGEMSIRFYDKNNIRNVKTSVDMQKREVTFKFLTGGSFDWMQARGEWFDIGGKIQDILPQTLEVLHEDKHHARAVFKLSDNAPVWDEYHPVLCRMTLHPADSTDNTEVCFGLTDFKADGLELKSHGRPVFLRGKHDGMIFPLTGHAPTTVEEWLK